MDRSVTECALSQKRPYSTRLRCRAAESDCFGNVRVYSGRACRERGYRDDVSLCTTHSRLLRDEYYRCVLTFDSISCSGTLESCPERIFAALEDITGVPSAYLCRFHRKGVDSMDAVVSHKGGISPKCAKHTPTTTKSPLFGKLSSLAACIRYNHVGSIKNFL